MGNNIQLMDTLQTFSSLTIPIVNLYDNSTFAYSEDGYIIPPLAGAPLYLGFYSLRYNNILVFRNVQLNNCDNIISAHIDFVSTINSGAGDTLIKISGLKNRGGYVIMPDKYTPEQISHLPRTGDSQ
jgi:hypothetical protein